MNLDRYKKSNFSENSKFVPNTGTCLVRKPAIGRKRKAERTGRREKKKDWKKKKSHEARVRGRNRVRIEREEKMAEEEGRMETSKK